VFDTLSSWQLFPDEEMPREFVADEPDSPDRAKDAFVGGVLEDFRRMHSQIDLDVLVLNRKIEHASAEVERLHALGLSSLANVTAIGAEQTNITSMRGQLRDLQMLRDRMQTPHVPTLRDQYRRMMAIPCVRAVWVHESRIVCRTDPLFGQDHHWKWRRIGPFRISFEIRNPELKTFRWINLEGAKGIHHGPPNIATVPGQKFGTVGCPGDLALGIINKAAPLHDYATLLSFAVRYPECAGSVRTHTMNLWPLVPLDQVPEWYRVQFKR
jgi:hypothetical protein